MSMTVEQAVEIFNKYLEEMGNSTRLNLDTLDIAELGEFMVEVDSFLTDADRFDELDEFTEADSVLNTFWFEKNKSSDKPRVG